MFEWWSSTTLCVKRCGNFSSKGSLWPKTGLNWSFRPILGFVSTFSGITLQRYEVLRKCLMLNVCMSILYQDFFCFSSICRLGASTVGYARARRAPYYDPIGEWENVKKNFEKFQKKNFLKFFFQKCWQLEKKFFCEFCIENELWRKLTSEWANVLNATHFPNGKLTFQSSPASNFGELHTKVTRDAGLNWIHVCLSIRPLYLDVACARLLNAAVFLPSCLWTFQQNYRCRRLYSKFYLDAAINGSTC